MLDLLKQPWPWYIGGPAIGLMVPLLLILTNRAFGISSSFRHICAACFPGNISYFKYNWKEEKWNLLFVAGVICGGVLAAQVLNNPAPMQIDKNLAAELAGYGINDHSALVPQQLFNWQELQTLRGLLVMVAGGFLVGFGTRYAGGCTSGHSIMGISNLQVGSLVATVCFMIGGILVANFLLPLILNA